VIPLATQLDLLIDMLENLSREVQELKRGILPLLPLPPQLKPIISRVSEETDPILTDAYFRGVRRLVQEVEDRKQNPKQPLRANLGKAKKIRTKSQKRNDKLQSQAFARANKALRKTNGQMRKGITQRDIAARAQRELRKLKKNVVKRVKR